MCCRYYMEMSPELRPIVEAAERSKLRENNLNWLNKRVITQGEVYPDNLVPVIATGKSGGKKVFPMVWGYHMEGLNRPIINARSETAMAKKTFRESWMNHRCIVPASWYYEWAHHLRPDEKKRSWQEIRNNAERTGAHLALRALPAGKQLSAFRAPHAGAG